MALTPEDIKYFEDMDVMFGTYGWRRFVDEAKAQIYQYQAQALEAPNFELVCFLRGQAEQLNRIINLPDTLATVRTQAEQADE